MALCDRGKCTKLHMMRERILPAFGLYGTEEVVLLTVKYSSLLSPPAGKQLRGGRAAPKFGVFGAETKCCGAVGNGEIVWRPRFAFFGPQTKPNFAAVLN